MAHKQILTHMFPTKVSFLSSFYEHVAIKRYMAPVHEMNQQIQTQSITLNGRDGTQHEQSKNT